MRTEVDDLIKLMEPIAASRGLALHEFFQMLLEMSPRELLGEREAFEAIDIVANRHGLNSEELGEMIREASGTSGKN